MKTFLVLRDSLLFLLGAAVIIQQLLSGHPDSMLIQTGAGMTGLPAWLHTYAITRTGSTQPASPEPVSPSVPDSPSGQT